MHDRTEEFLERELQDAWDAIRRELIDKEFYDRSTDGRYTVATVEAVHGRYLIGRSYLVRDKEGREFEIVPAPLDAKGDVPYVVLDPEAVKAAARRQARKADDSGRLTGLPGTAWPPSCRSR